MNTTSTTTSTTSGDLALAVLGTINPVVETSPARLNAMADALDHYATVAEKSGRVAFAASRRTRATHLRSLAGAA